MTLRIKKVEAYPLNIGYKPGFEFTVSYGTISQVSNIVVKITTEEDIQGLGEATPLPVFNGETQEAVMAVMKIFAPLIIGEEASNISKIHEKMDTIVGNVCAKGAVDIALYDILGKATKLPVYKLLGGAFAFDAPMHYTISIKSPEEMAEESVRRVDEGFRTLEIKVGKVKGRASVDDDVARVRAVRDAVGQGVILIVDSNIGWTVREAIAAIRRIEGLDVLVEQPVRTMEGLREVKSKVSAPIIADESCQSVDDAAKIIRTEAADIISMKITKVGGFYRAVKILSMCEAFGLGYRYDNQIQTRLAGTAALHLNMAFSRGIPSGGTQFLRHSQDFVAQGGLKIEKGVSRLDNPDSPGLGVTAKEELLGPPAVYT
ncbi:MAG: dipeptide epimerase [Thaumarchaeota archaeon]|nr:dipeptide epimerase [Nitrososphaerota archaeon]